MQRHLGAVLGLALVLAGCATVSPTSSFVQSSAPTDNSMIASNVADFLRTELPPAKTTLVIEPSATGDQALLAQLGETLRRDGFAIAAPGSGAVAQPLRLLVTPLYTGFVVRIDYGSSEAGTYFGRDTSGQLQASSPFVRREV